MARYHPSIIDHTVALQEAWDLPNAPNCLDFGCGFLPIGYVAHPDSEDGCCGTHLEPVSGA